MSLLLEITIYSSVIFLVTVAFKAVFRKRLSPRMHAWIWALFILRLLIPFTIESDLNLFEIPEKQAAKTTQTQPAAKEKVPENADPVPSDIKDQAAGTAYTAPEAKWPAQVQAGNDSFEFPTQKVLLAAWLAGIGLSLAHLLYVYCRLRQDIRRNAVFPSNRLYRLLNDCRAEMRISEEVRILVQRGSGSPALLFPNTILIPEEALFAMDTHQIRLAIMHELAHYKRKDHILSLFLALLRAVYWFNPAVWLANKCIHDDIETACDHKVIERLKMKDKGYYAKTVLSMYRNGNPDMVLGMALGNGRKSVEQRIKGIFLCGKTRYWAKAITAVMACAIFVSCFTTACQPTPEKQAVVNKSKTDLDAVADESNQNADVDKLKIAGIPEGNYTYESKSDDGTITVKVDAEVEVPGNGKMPMARMAPANFEQENVTKIYNYLFPDGAQLMDGKRSKPEIEEEMLEYQRMISTKKHHSGEALDNESIKMYEELVEELKEEMKTAPDKKPAPVISDGTMQAANDGIEDYLSLDVSVNTNDGNWAFMGVMTGFKKEGDSMFVYSNSPSDEAVNYTMDGAIAVKEGDAVPEKARGKLNTTVNEAKKQADDFFKAAGYEDVQLFAAYVVDDHGTGHVDNDYSAASRYAYKLYYTPTINGAPVAVHASDALSVNDYSLGWFFEKITVIVDDTGIIELDWQWPTKVTEMMSENTDIIQFNDAVKIFEQNIVNKYLYTQFEYDERTVEIGIDRIVLTPVRQRDKDKADERVGVFVPAYVFYGYAKEYTKNAEGEYEGYMTTSSGTGSDIATGPLAVMAINAVDGSLIDMDQ